MSGLEDNKELPRNSIIVIPAGAGPPCIFAMFFLPNLSHMGQVTMSASQRPLSPDFLQVVHVFNNRKKADARKSRKSRLKMKILITEKVHRHGPRPKETQEKELSSGITFTQQKYYIQRKTILLPKQSHVGSRPQFS